MSLNEQIKEDVIDISIYIENTHQNTIDFRMKIESALGLPINLMGFNLQYKSKIEKTLLDIISNDIYSIQI